MSKRRILGVTIVAVAAVALAGGLIASNMGFKLNYTLVAATNPVAGPGESGTSLDGTSLVALPFNRQGGLNSASALRTDIGAAAGPVARLLRSNNSQQSYTGVRGSVDFTFVDQYDCYQVKVNGTTNVQYVIVGSDKPGVPLTLYASGNAIPANLGGGSSLDGTNCYPYAYHSTAATASALRADIGAAAGPVSRLTRHNNSLLSYTGVRGSVDFPLTPGEGYYVKVNGVANVLYTPSHY